MKYTASRTIAHTQIFFPALMDCVCVWGKDRERVWCDYGYWFLFWLWFLPTSAIQDLLGVAEPSQQPLVQWTIFLLFLGCCMPPSTFCCCLPLIHLAVSCFAPILHTAKMRSRLNLLVGCHSIYSKLYGIKHRVNIVFVCNGRFFFSGVTHISIHHQSWTFDLTAMYTVTRSHSAGPPPFGMLSATAITYNVNTHIALYIP